MDLYIYDIYEMSRQQYVSCPLQGPRLITKDMGRREPTTQRRYAHCLGLRENNHLNAHPVEYKGETNDSHQFTGRRLMLTLAAWL